MKRVDKLLAAITILGVGFWSLVILMAPEPFYGAVYTIGLCSTLGALLWFRFVQVKEALQSWRARPLVKFLLVGYATVLYEEVFAAFANHLPEGFSFALYLERIGEFWALNIFAFTGFILGWYVLTRRYAYSYREVFYLAGFWGIYAEHIYAHGPLGFITLLGSTMVTYGIIALPMVLTVTRTTQREIPRLRKYLLTYVVIFILSIAPILLLQSLRAQHPEAFPPASMVPL